MAEEKTLNKYFENYSASIFNKVGKDFSYSAFLEKSKSKSIRPSGLIENFYEEVINFPWLQELEMVTEKIMSIASKPRTHIKVEKDVKKAEQAVKIDNYDVIETLKVPAYWKRKGDRFLPEKVFTDIFEIEYAIYENRFIINLVDKMMLFLSQIISQLYNQIRKVNAHFIDFHVPLGDVELIQDIADYEAFRGLRKSSARARVRDDKVTLLTTKDSPYVEALRRILRSRANVGHVRSTPFYKDVKKAKPLSDTDVHLTNMLAGDASYAPCYDFYRKLLPMLTQDIGTLSDVEPKSYHNYVLSNLFAAFSDVGFTDTTRRNAIKFSSENIIELERYCITKGVLDCYITTHDVDHIELEFELKEDNFKGTYNLKNKKYSRVSLDLVPSFTAEYPNTEELSEYFRKKNISRIHQGFTSSFIITPVDGTQKDDVMICSPRVYKIDANLKSMIDSCTLFAEGDNFIYSHVCPVCGFYVDGEQDDGNCYCTNCDSAYTLIKAKHEDEAQDSVWIKRMKNPERI